MAALRTRRLAPLALALLALLGVYAPAAPPTTAPVIGLAQNTPAVFALTNLRIVTEPGKVIEKGSIVVREGVIEAAGADVQPPADAQRIDLAGKTAYAGLVDAYSEQNVPADPIKQGAPSWNANVAPQLDMAQHYVADEALNSKLRSQGIAARLVAPAQRIIKGQSIIVSTAPGENSRVILKNGVAQHIRLTVSFGGPRGEYPGSPMGAVALARQTMLDADWYGRAWAAWRGNSQLPRPERNDALAALAPLLGGSQPTIINAANEQFVLRADRFSREFGLTAIVQGSGREYRRLNEVKALGRPIIVPVNFPQAPSVGTVEDALDTSLTELMHWDIAPENPARLDAAGVTIALTSHGLRDQATFLAAVRRAVERGLKPDSALAAVTTTPAALVGLNERLGKIAPGMLGNLVITDGDLFNKKTKVVETWVDGRRFEHDKPPTIDVRGSWQMEITGSDDRVLRLKLKLAGPARQPTGTLSKVVPDGEKADDIRLAGMSLNEGQLNWRLEGKSLGKEGTARVSATIMPASGKRELPDSAATEPMQRNREADASRSPGMSLLGKIVWADGTSEQLSGERTAKLTLDEEKAAGAQKAKSKGKATAAEGETVSPSDVETEKKEPAASYAVTFPFGDFGRTVPPEQPEVVAFKNATVWTCGPAGIIEGATVVVREGKIAAVGKDAAIPAGAVVVDCTGRFLSPGIIDCHSHMATDGGVNEGSQAITAEVRVGDFVDPDDITIYRQLAGGVTAANILHGSANPIGGQNQVIKLRWGLTGEQMKFAAAPQGIKFALGENVKQSSREAETATRYPQSRMGVEQIIRDAFHRAKDYAAAHERWNAVHEGLPPRRDLELEALAEILAKRRWIHCHSYRQDEILALLRTCEEFGITIGSLQHILEGYKLADAISRHGATGSSFSDWWAYKIEVWDAIPYNGALMHRAGVVVSFNSDDAELGRHLNHEAAKAMKYGGVTPEEALKFVTLNPAKQLRIDQWTGSLEVGKDADLVVWSGDPLSTRSRCEQTWIDGRKYFDRAGDQALRAEQAQMRTALIRKVIESGAAMQSAGPREPEEWELWARYDEYCAHGRK